MRIGIDTSRFTLVKAGIATYIQELVGNLLKNDNANEYVLFCLQRNYEDCLQLAGGKARVVVVNSSPKDIFGNWGDDEIGHKVSKEKIDVFHAPNAHLPGALNCPGVVTIHDLIFNILPDDHGEAVRTDYQTSTEKSLSVANRVISPSECTKNDIVEHYSFSPDKIEVIPQACSREFYHTHAKKNNAYLRAVQCKYGIEGKFILYAGHIRPRKNLLRLIKAYQEAKKMDSQEPYQLVIVGEVSGTYDSTENEVFRFIQDSQIEDVILTGYVPSDDLPCLYAAATLFIYISLYEGFGIPILEAMATGVPVIGSKVSSIPEVAGKGAILVDPENVSDIAEAIRSVLINPKLRHKLIRTGFEQVSRFSWQQTAHRTLQVYRDAYQQQ